MNLHKLFKILAAVLGVAGIVFLVRIIATGDDTIKADALMGDTAIIDPIAYVAYIIMALVIGFVLIFVLKNLFTNPKSLKNALIGVGAFVLLALVCYFAFAEGVETPLRDGEVLSEGGSKLVGAGLYMFYFLVFIAGGAMLYSGVKKMINR
ncbi:membrane protein [Mangrovimonas yunxiaonensis]|uniref:Membrane protein n=1 Tax=Mangrovimonas yunxiaonensis TaxID=1197477 RepID=A0A084TMJ3_9FLAO|nr:hypothetical protein [Mangrovimonas yunxiaonensis]KFB01929.1 membrane protein [Mangrovimonas yunxiaonensis]MBR9757333.1 hypothetical protein [Algicola sp.]GGH44789.1 hypothetical protein GCM10011364_17800 [Mangrovimonas yunxiaonensis]